MSKKTKFSALRPKREVKLGFMRAGGKKPSTSVTKGKRRIGLLIPNELLLQVEHHCVDIGKSVSAFTEELYAQALAGHSSGLRERSG